METNSNYFQSYGNYNHAFLDGTNHFNYINNTATTTATTSTNTITNNSNSNYNIDNSNNKDDNNNNSNNNNNDTVTFHTIDKTEIDESITPESVQRISQELISEQYDCVICLERIHRTDRLWSCSSCFHVFHLRCVAEWAEAQRTKREEQLRSTSNAPPSTAHGTFDCACCKSANLISSTLTYYCYCGKVRDPRVDLLLVPGSCGETCGKRRRDVHCPHRCTLLCHPGCCPPCNLMRPQQCYCGKVTQTVGCSSNINGFECDNVCDKLLNCNRHRCTELCHEGPCPICQEIVTERCYCGADSRKRVCGTIPPTTSSSLPLISNSAANTNSGTVNREHCHNSPSEQDASDSHTKLADSVAALDISDNATHRESKSTLLATSSSSSSSTNSEEEKVKERTSIANDKDSDSATTAGAKCQVEESIGGYSCGRRCSKMRDCGNHECGNVCHPGSCEICLRLPGRQKCCPCGKTRITAIRTSCLDPIPSCGLPCELPLPCGHLCWYTCHDDSPCAPCKELIKETCRCKGKTFSIPCFCQYLPESEWKNAASLASFPPEKLPQEYPPKCQRICRKQLSCHKHTCTEVCCVDTEHICCRICSKKLSCGIHKCGMLCHSGPCPGCTYASYEPLFCRCRRTYVAPPVPCGTPIPTCPYPCIVPRLCGHPPMHNCHPDSEPCPVCTVPVQKFCASHHQPMPYHMPCHLTDVSCGRKCRKLLTCCNRLCDLPCHGGPCKHDCSRSFPSFADIAKRYEQTNS